ncbi:MAG: FAD-binding oxidoreductase [Arhodomonas sp.]|nr:FAD-binding oxidoreductase [Arhodomonas sp.]
MLGQLNAALAPHGLFFPPHTSTASRATVGGMVGTDASGKGSRRYGRTGDYLLEVALALPDGRRYRFRRLSAETSRAAETAGARAATALRAIIEPHREAIRSRFPAMSRSLTGYNLRDAFPDSGEVDLGRLVAGAEGTLGLVTELVLRIVPLPRHQSLVVVRYPDFDDALADAQRLLVHEPSAVETLDQRIFSLARSDSDWPRVREALAGDRGDDAPPLVTNFIEFSDTDPEVVEQRVAALRAELEGRDDHAGFHVTAEAALIGQLWNVRAKGVGLLGRTPGRRKPVPFVGGHGGAPRAPRGLHPRVPRPARPPRRGLRHVRPRRRGLPACPAHPGPCRPGGRRTPAGDQRRGGGAGAALSGAAVGGARQGGAGRVHRDLLRQGALWRPGRGKALLRPGQSNEPGQDREPRR